MRLLTLLIPLSAALLLAGCSTGGIFKNYPGARNNGEAITIANFELEDDHKHFCVYKIDIQVDDMPQAAPPLLSTKPYCTHAVTNKGVFVNTGGKASFFPLLDYDKVTVRVVRTLDGPDDVYVLHLNGGMLNPPPDAGAKINSLRIVVTASGVRAYRWDSGPKHFSNRLIAETKEKQ